jgi:hypothetical protein
MSRTMQRFARIAIRPDGDTGRCLILGLTNPEVFKPGHLYEIVEFDGEHIIRDLGLSAATPDDHPVGVTWSRDANGLVIDGGHLLTVEEHKAKMASLEERDSK